MPFTCGNVYVTYKKPITFLGTTDEIDRIQMVFESSRKYWVSSRTKLTMFTETTPVMMVRNFFAKLVEPIISEWWTHGLGQKPYGILSFVF